MQKKNSAICIVLVTLLLSAFLLIRPVAAEEPEYRNISVQQAKHMIKHNPNIVILDVRNQSEYDQGHLYGAILLPLNLIENWDWNWNSTPVAGQPYINFLQAHADDTVIVYCKGGSRSAVVCQILVEQGFTKVYNMIGGIIAWMQADYPIYTRYHHVSADFVNEQLVVQIEPWLLYQANCTLCQNQTCVEEEIPTNTTVTVLEESENRTVLLITGEVNGTAVEYTIDTTLLWRWSTLEDEFNRTVTFVSTEVNADGESNQLLILKYKAQHEDFTVTVITSLFPSSVETFDGSLTLMTYAPLGKVAVKSRESVECNSPITLSQQYKMLSKTANKVGRMYEKSEDTSLRNLAEAYYMMKEEVARLSKIVKEKMPQYDLTISSGIKGTVGVGLSAADPEAVLNGGFEDYYSYWTVGGDGEHIIEMYGERYSGVSSMRIGWRWATPVANSWDYAYQLIYIPETAINIQLSLAYKLYTEDSLSYDRIEVYIAPYGGDPQLMFSAGGGSRGGLETIGWATWSTSLENYRGYSVYIYIAVYNGYDTNYRTYCYVDDVSLSYDEIQECNIESWLQCAWEDYNIATYCGWLLEFCAYIPSWYNPFCVAAVVCSLGIAIYCALEYCVW